MLEGDLPDREKRITLRTIDDLWADYLAEVTEYRSGIQWVSWSGRDPHREYLLKVHEWFRDFETALAEEIARRVDSSAEELPDRGTVWTYLTTDQPFQAWKHQLAREVPFWIGAAMGMGG